MPILCVDGAVMAGSPGGAGSGRGGSGRGQGRRPVKQGEETVTVSLRMTKSQRQKLELLGGAPFMRRKIDEADPSEFVAPAKIAETKKSSKPKN